jgi:predicted alpha-1,2-mannosidase
MYNTQKKVTLRCRVAVYGIYLLAGLAVVIVTGCRLCRCCDDNKIADVNLFIGTGGHGHTFPGATVPNGMVQLSPDTRTKGWDACGGFYDADQTIIGFSHTHLSGTGCGDLGDILFMPTIGDVPLEPGDQQNTVTGYRSRFRKSTQSAQPGYYSVQLDDYNVRAELTVTKRTGMHRYTYPAGQQPRVVLDLNYALHNQKNKRLMLHVISPTEIEGTKITQGWSPHQEVHFYARFSKPFSCQIQKGGRFLLDAKQAEGENLKALLRFEPTDLNTVMAQVAISSVDPAGARRNFDAEFNGWDFDAVRMTAAELWADELDCIKVQGGSPTERRIFYSALYHLSISPTLHSDVDGRYRGSDYKVHKAEGYDGYTLFSLWDTFRTRHPLETILRPSRNSEFVRSILSRVNEGGLLPMWELSGNDNGCMIGYHAVPVIVDAYMKGDRSFDAEKAFAACVKAAEYHPDAFPPEMPQKIREKIMPKSKHEKNTRGWIPCDSENASVSRGLEYAYNDWCIAQFAKALGKSAEYRRFSDLARNYRHYYDRQTGFMRGRKSDGTWNSPFDPRSNNHWKDDYCEGNAWQWSWFVPHDPAGLMELMGGKVAYIKKLDQLFVEPSVITGDKVAADISGLIGQYAHGNEPSHHTVYMYHPAGQPWKANNRIDQILRTLYFDAPDGLSGNEDCGQMSAWYVMNAMGFYSFCPGDPRYMIGRPLFDRVTIKLENGRTFKVIAYNNSVHNKFVRRALINGKELADPWFIHDDIMQGATLELYMTSNRSDCQH